mgnify:CR=1 FL=1
MLKKISTSIVAFAILASSNLVANDVNSDISISGNIGVTNDLVWRGMTQNNEEISIFGGFDAAHNSGFYAGTWLASNNIGTELDLYAGFSKIGRASCRERV